MVAYDGTQAPGFHIDKVPEGFFIQGSDAYVLTLAREGDTTHFLGFVGKIVI